MHEKKFCEQCPSRRLTTFIFRSPIDILWTVPRLVFFCSVLFFFSVYFFSAVCMCRFFPVLLHGNFHKHVSALFVLIAFFTFDAEGLCTRCYFFSTADLIETERFFFLVRWISCKNQRHLIQELEYSNQSQLSVQIFFVYNFRPT